MSDWHQFNDLFSMVETIVDDEEADQTKPTFDKIFDRMLDLCRVARIGEEIESKSQFGGFADEGSLILYVRLESDVGLEDPCQLVPYALTQLSEDGDFFLRSLSAEVTQSVAFSHSEPNWPAYVWSLLERTHWRVLNKELLARS